MSPQPGPSDYWMKTAETQPTRQLNQLPFDPELTPGARNAVQVCLRVPPAEDLETSQVSIFAVQAQMNELKSRMQMTDVVNRKKIRHAHMVNINRRIMLEGMRADFKKVDRLSTKVAERVRVAKQIRAKTAAGTDLTADLNPSYRWLKT